MRKIVAATEALAVVCQHVDDKAMKVGRQSQPIAVSLRSIRAACTRCAGSGPELVVRWR